MTTKAERKSKSKKPPHETVGMREGLKINKWAFKFIYDCSPKQVKFFLASISFEALYTTVNTYILARILDVVIRIVQDRGTLANAYPYMLFLVGFNLFSSAAGYYRKSSERTLEILLKPYLERALYKKVQGLGIQSMEQPGVANMIRRVQEESYTVGNHFFGVAGLFAQVVTVSTSALLVAYYMPIIIPIVMIFYVPVYLNDKKYRRLIWKNNYDFTEDRRLGYHLSWSLTSASQLLEIFINKAHGLIDKKFSDYINPYIAKTVTLRRKFIFGEYMFGVFEEIGVYVGYFLVFSRFLAQRITVGDVYFQLNLIDRFSRAIDLTMQHTNLNLERTIRLKDMYTLFQKEPAFADGATDIPKLEVGPEVVISDLNFKYPRSEKLVIKNLNLRIKSGEKIAIVGANGAGKTTLVKLLSKMYLPSSGKITINGIDITDVSMSSWYDNLGVMFQEFNTYGPMSVKENVQIGKPSEELDVTAMAEALGRADALDFVNDLPNKLDQILSEQYKGGTRLSTGQWQKLAIARFFYRDAPMVIYDEPTASIDAVSEYNIFNKIYGFFEGKTVIIVSHRFSTVRNADRIIVLDKGEIVEEGRHDQLMKKDGYYAKSFRLQAEGYTSEPVETIA